MTADHLAVVMTTPAHAHRSAMRRIQMPFRVSKEQKHAFHDAAHARGLSAQQYFELLAFGEITEVAPGRPPRLQEELPLTGT